MKHRAAIIQRLCQQGKTAKPWQRKNTAPISPLKHIPVPCPACHATGTYTEDTRIYEFITRNPTSGVCLLCNGKKYIHPPK